MAKFKNNSTRLLSFRFWTENAGKKFTETLRFIPTQVMEISATQKKKLMELKFFNDCLEDGLISEIKSGSTSKKSAGRPKKEAEKPAENENKEIPVAED